MQPKHSPLRSILIGELFQSIASIHWQQPNHHYGSMMVKPFYSYHIHLEPGPFSLGWLVARPGAKHYQALRRRHRPVLYGIEHAYDQPAQ